MSNIITTNPFTEVEIKPVEVAGITQQKNAVMVTDDEGNQTLAGIHSLNYQLIKNSMAHDITSDIIAKSGYVFKPLKTIWDGKRFADLYITENKIEDVNGDEMYLGLKVTNSYDGSLIFGIEAFAFNMKCSNQYHYRNRFGFEAIKHTQNLTFDIASAVKSLSAGMQRVIEIFPILRQMQHQKLQAGDLIKLVGNIKFPLSKWGDVLLKLKQEQDTIYGLFQALTWVTTHKMQGFNGIQYSNAISEKLINGHQLGQNFLQHNPQ